MAWFEHEGCSLHYEEYGHGAPLILIHGLGSSCLDWELQVPVLSQHYRLVVVDVRGHGRSDKPRERYSIAGFTADLMALIEHLHLPPAHVVGLSMGGMICQQLGVRYPDKVLSLGLCDTASEMPDTCRMRHCCSTAAGASCNHAGAMRLAAEPARR